MMQSGGPAWVQIVTKNKWLAGMQCARSRRKAPVRSSGSELFPNRNLLRPLRPGGCRSRHDRRMGIPQRSGRRRAADVRFGSYAFTPVVRDHDVMAVLGLGG